MTENSSPLAIFEPEVPSPRLLRRWLHKQLALLEAERAADHEQSRLLTSNSPPKVLEANGLALLGLGVVSLTVGAGGNYQLELERPSGFHASPIFPAHSIRTGDLVQIEDHAGGDAVDSAIQGVVARVWDARIILSIKADRQAGSSSSTEGDLDLPTRCRVVKVANDVTYNRLDATMEKVTEMLGIELPQKVVLPALDEKEVLSKHQSDPIPLIAPPAPQRVQAEEGKAELPDNAQVPEQFVTAALNDGFPEVAAPQEPPPVTSADATSASKSPAPSETPRMPKRRRPSPTPLMQSLFGLRTPQWAPAPKCEVRLPHTLFNQDLNATQICAIDFCMRSQHFALLHGPPGTGKTTTLAELVLQTACGEGDNESGDRGGTRKRVLVAAASNLAVDNLAEKILRGWQTGGGTKDKLRVTRLGHPARVFSSLSANTLDEQIRYSDEGQLLRDVGNEMNSIMGSLNGETGPAAGNKSTRGRGRGRGGRGALRGAARRAGWEELRALRKEFRNRERGVSTSVLSRADVVLCTCHGAGGRVLDELERKQGGFDLVVIDEACQALEAACWIPILRAKRDGGKLVLAGDHLQLPPTVKGVTRMDLEKRKGAQGKARKEGDGKVEIVDAATKERASPLGDFEMDAKKGEILDVPANEVADDGGSEDETEDGDDHSKEREDPTNNISERPAEVRIRHPTLRPPRTLETTLFSRLLGLYGAGCKALLSVQYRMNDEIMAFANSELYEGKLQSHESCKDGRLDSLLENGTAEADDDGLMSPLVFYDTSGCDMFESNSGSSDGKATLMSESKRNQNEAVLVHKHISLLIERGVRPEDIGVIAPYAAQTSLLADTIRPLGPVDISTVDGFQGREKEAIVISLVRSNPERAVGFLAEHRRLNVGMTRPKKHLAIVGDARTVGAEGGYLRRWMDHLEQEAVVVVPE